MKIGIMVSSFRLPLEDSIRKASELGVKGVQVNVRQEPQMMYDWSDSKVADLVALCRDLGLEICSISGDVADGHALQINGKNMERARELCRTIDLALKLGTRVMTSHIGVIPDDPADPVRLNMLQALREVALYAVSRGVTMAIETGPESPETLKSFIEQVNVPGGLGVNLDPANLRMVGSFDPVHAVKLLGKWIVHTHAKDGINLKSGPAYVRYGVMNPDGTPRVFNEPRPEVNEVPLGKGQVAWDEYLAALRNAGYNAYLTIEREAGDNREGDIRHAVEFLQKKLGC